MYRAIVFAALLIPFCNAVLAEDLGVRGAVFPIAEPDLFSQIAAKFEAMEASGEVEAINRRLRERAIAAAERPKRVPDIGPTNAPRSFYYDPAVTVNGDIVTPDGDVIARAGTSFNPLDYTPMHQKLIFFNGEADKQVVWAIREMAQSDAPVTPVLVAGPVLDLTREWSRQVYFDQGGRLVSQFGIRHTPARISREGDRLLIEEVTP